MIQPRECSGAVRYQRSNDLAGVEIRTFDASAETWHNYTTSYEFMVTDSWRGEIRHRQRSQIFRPGMLLSAHPGEHFFSPWSTARGSLCSLLIDDRLLHSYVAEHALGVEDLAFREFTQTSGRLRTRLARVLLSIRLGSSVLTTESLLADFAAVLVEEVLDKKKAARWAGCDLQDQLAARVREHLHRDVSAKIGLSTLAQQTGKSRFQVLRAFKRRYGVSPHTYQLILRLSMAKRALREGKPSAQVATACGFVDQSHLARHFKRVLGVTPGQYALVGGSVEPRPGAVRHAVVPGGAPRPGFGLVV